MLCERSYYPLKEATRARTTRDGHERFPLNSGLGRGAVARSGFKPHQRVPQNSTEV